MLFSKLDIARRGASTIGDFKRRGGGGKKFFIWDRFWAHPPSCDSSQPLGNAVGPADNGILGYRAESAAKVRHHPAC